MEKEKEAYEIRSLLQSTVELDRLNQIEQIKGLTMKKINKKKKNVCKTFVTLRDLAWHTMLQRRNVNTFQMLQS